jgi:hypothetical protein
MGSHLFTSRSGSNLGIRMRKKPTYLYTFPLQLADEKSGVYCVKNVEKIVMFLPKKY